MKRYSSYKHHRYFYCLLFSFFVDKKRHCLGQMMSEYAIVILIIVSAVTAMMTFSKRALQARSYDAQKIVMKEAGAGLGLDKPLPMEYEPYYYQRHTTTETNQVDKLKKTFDDEYKKELEMNKITNVYSVQQAPRNE